MKLLKTCRKCKKEAYTEEQLKDFVKDKKNNDGYATICKSCSRDHTRKARKNYDDTIEKHIQEYIGSDTYTCRLCGFTHKYSGIFDWHHYTDNKTDSISNMKRNQLPWSTIKKELDKCTLLCSNCHRLVHRPST